MLSFGIAHLAQALACPSMGLDLTVVFLTFSVLVQGGGGVVMRIFCVSKLMIEYLPPGATMSTCTGTAATAANPDASYLGCMLMWHEAGRRPDYSPKWAAA